MKGACSPVLYLTMCCFCHNFADVTWQRHRGRLALFNAQIHLGMIRYCNRTLYFFLHVQYVLAASWQGKKPAGLCQRQAFDLASLRDRAVRHIVNAGCFELLILG